MLNLKIGVMTRIGTWVGMTLMKLTLSMKINISKTFPCLAQIVSSLYDYFI